MDLELGNQFLCNWRTSRS